MKNLLIPALLAAIPSFLWFYFWYRRDNQKEPTSVLIQALVIGALGGLMLLPLRYSLPELSLPIIVILTALLEETVKCVSIVMVTNKNYKYFDQVIDGIIYAVAVALGFAFIENMVYITEFMQSGMPSVTFWGIYFLRCVTTTLAHSIFSGVFGFAYASAYLLPEDYAPMKYDGKAYCCRVSKFSRFTYMLRLIFEVLTLRVLFRHVIKDKPTIKKRTGNHLVIEGILCSIYLHSLFNALALLTINGKNYAYLIPALVLFTALGLMSKFAIPKYKRVIKRELSPTAMMTE